MWSHPRVLEGDVAVVCDDDLLVGRLLKGLLVGWTRFRIVDLREREDIVRREAIILIERHLDDPRIEDRHTELERFARRVPLVICTAATEANARRSAAVGATATVYLSLASREVLRLQLERILHVRLLAPLVEALGVTDESPVVLRRALDALAAQGLPRKVGIGRMSKPYIRHVRDLAADVGVSRQDLSRLASAHGIPLHHLVRWTTLLHGLELHRRTGAHWSTVARALGFSELSGWTNFVKRLTGQPPTGLETLSPWHWREAAVKQLLDAG